MESRIRRLDEQTINQIAAGEVIENPASVVKELVENAIDAGATSITVEIRGGGRQLIRVSDNGCGMTADDALLSLERHATSKLRELNDLDAISTMGFRGEAVPSIASISKFTLMTRPDDQAKGTMVIVDGGKIVSNTPVACENGTIIEVKSLFFNVPVRKKFQRSPTYDVNEITKSLSLQAIGHPDLSFTLISQEKVLFKTTAGESLGDRISAVLGQEFTSTLTETQAEVGDLKLHGFIGRPGFSRQNRTGQYLYINQRAVTCPFLSHVVREAYGTALAPQRFPVFVLHLSIPGGLVDVNVHPQKREVRLRQVEELKELVISAVHKTIKVPEPTMMVAEPIQSYRPYPTFEKKSVEPPPFYTKTKAPPPEPVSFIPEPKQKPKARVLATMKQYVILDEPGALCLLDQRAAHARVIFDQLSKGKESLAVQQLLIPETIEVTPKESEMIQKNLNVLQEMGFQIEGFGKTTFIVQSVPQVLQDIDLSSFIPSIVEALEEYQGSEMDRIREKHLSEISRRAAVNKNKILSLVEAQSLVDQLMKCEVVDHCPNGKPTIREISNDEIEKLFAKG